jgi:hypothetical protein
MTKTLVVSLVLTKTHTNLHVHDISTHESITIRDVGTIPSFQQLVNYVRKNGEMDKSETMYSTFKGKLRSWPFTRYRVFISNSQLLELLPSPHVGEVKKIADLCRE